MTDADTIESCSTCKYFAPSPGGPEGNCHGGTPIPEYGDSDPMYRVWWPRVRIGDRCPTWTPIE